VLAFSTGDVPASIKGMADRAAQFIAATGHLDIDLLGFSMGGYVARIVTLDYPHLVRKLVLALARAVDPEIGANVLRL